MYGISVEIAELDLYEGITAEVRRFVLMDFFFLPGVKLLATTISIFLCYRV